MLVEKKVGPVRVGYKTITETVKRKEVTRKVRYSKKSGEVLD
jgi:large subunit ribosomal protein L24